MIIIVIVVIGIIAAILCKKYLPPKPSPNPPVPVPDPDPHYWKWQLADKLWVYGDDYIPCTNQTFWNGVNQYGYLALYAIGILEVGWPHKWNTKEISKWDTKEIMKWNGVE